LLEGYCNLAVHARQIDQNIRAINPEEDDAAIRYRRLLNGYSSLTRDLANMAVRLGLASASRVNTAKPIQGVVSVPWANARR
jgi:hypothetical protein